MFTNDNLLLNKKIAKEFLEALIARDLKVRWKAFVRFIFMPVGVNSTRADSVQDEEVAELMAKSGCTYVMIGVESAHQQVLDNMNKVCKVEVRKVFVCAIYSLR